MKMSWDTLTGITISVAICVGAWDENSTSAILHSSFKVAIYVGAWNEKDIEHYAEMYELVAICVGAWNEKAYLYTLFYRLHRRNLRRCME